MTEPRKATQIRFPKRTTFRTVFQTTVALAAITPALVAAIGVDDTLPIVGGILAGAAAITRVMAMPQVEDFLQNHVSFLAARPKPVPADAPAEGTLPDNHRDGV